MFFIVSNVRAFSLQDEARNTESGHLWASNRNLRYPQVKFVSAESSTPDKPTLPQDVIPTTSGSDASCPLRSRAPLADMPIEDTEGSSMRQDHPAQRHPGPRHQAELLVEGHKQEPEEPLFFVDTNGSRKVPTVGTGLREMPRSLSPLYSDSSEEVIVFGGRRKTEQNCLDEVGIEAKEPICMNRDSLLTENRQSIGTAMYAKEDVELAWLHEPLPVRQLAESDRQRSKEIRRKHRRQQAMSGTEAPPEDEEDEVLADYIANTIDEERLDSPSRDITQDKHWARDHVLQPESLANSDGRAAQDTINALLDGSQDWSSSDMRDFNDLGTSSAEDFNFDKKVSKRRRPSSEQYLAIVRDQPTDDAHWQPASSISSTDPHKRIRGFQPQKVATETGATSSQDSTGSDDDTRLAADLQEDIENCRDELDLLERRRAKMTDEQIARLLSKQEELGLGSGELLLFDGDDIEAGDDYRRVPNVQGTALLSEFSAIGPRQRMGSNKAKQQLRHGIPSAMMFADGLDQDPYGGFDVMDRERPSLRKTPKGRRSAPTFELSDTELEASLQVAWDKDRSKKKLRKKEREVLRAQGRLGRPSKTDVKAKYREGISLEQVKFELMDFVASSRQSLALPPMAQQDRKMIHEMANALRLKSKSSGQGKSRFPVLYKTGRSGDFSGAAMGKVESLLNSKRFFPRKDMRRSRKSATSGHDRVTASNVAGVSYRDGEVVGAAAPEIGTENRGRAILEKMGWSKGTALGALNNKGMLQPVPHIVKTTKAGLG
ncbi:MAG: hypothetical protein L6R37_006478 [Teloschistes peruensis]|nr:MAG: hypothetical protein L6R37_006478 [Teloschistes peruensis]